MNEIKKYLTIRYWGTHLYQNGSALARNLLWLPKVRGDPQYYNEKQSYFVRNRIFFLLE
jgi:hypothetical protein